MLLHIFLLLLLHVFYSSETDLIPGLAAFFACLVFPLEIGILFGIGINIVFILYHAARPKIRIEYLAVRKIESFLFIYCLTYF